MHLGQRRVAAVGDMEHVQHLRQQRNARGQRNGLALQAQRPAGAIPVFVQRLDAGGHAAVETQLARDVGTAMAAGADQLVGHFLAVAQHVEDGLRALAPAAGVGAGVAEHEAQHLRQAGADQLEILFELAVIGEIQLADARRVAAAAQVFQQDGVVQIPQLRRRQPQRLADVHADPAATDAVAFRLALGDIQRVAERADEFGQFQGGRHGYPA
ncbi:hypothetical protein D3C78_1229740 [compost metagenome]